MVVYISRGLMQQLLAPKLCLDFTFLVPDVMPKVRKEVTP